MAISDDKFQQTPEQARDIQRRAMQHPSAKQIGPDLIRLAVDARAFRTVAQAQQVAQQASCPACGGTSSYSVDDMTLACNACGQQFPDPSEASVEAAAPPTTRQPPPGAQGGYPVPGEAIGGTGQPERVGTVIHCFGANADRTRHVQWTIETIEAAAQQHEDVVRCTTCRRVGLRGWAHECDRSWYDTVQELKGSLARFGLPAARTAQQMGVCESCGAADEVIVSFPVPGVKETPGDHARVCQKCSELDPAQLAANVSAFRQKYKWGRTAQLQIGDQVEHDDLDGTGEIIGGPGPDGSYFVRWRNGTTFSVTPSEVEMGIYRKKEALPEGHPDRAFASLSMRQLAQQNPMEPPQPGVNQEPPAQGTQSPQQGQPPAGPMGGPPGGAPQPPQIKRNPARTKEMWDPEGGFAREVEADGVDDLVRIHTELNAIGLAPSAQQPTAQQPQQPAQQQPQGQAYMAQWTGQPCEGCGGRTMRAKECAECFWHAPATDQSCSRCGSAEFGAEKVICPSCGQGIGSLGVPPERLQQEGQAWAAPSTAPMPTTAQSEEHDYPSWCAYCGENANQPSGAPDRVDLPSGRKISLCWKHSRTSLDRYHDGADQFLQSVDKMPDSFFQQGRTAQEQQCPQCDSPQPVWSPGAGQCAACGYSDGMDMDADGRRKKTPPGAPGKDQQIDLGIGTEGPGPGAGSPAGPPGGGTASRIAETGPCRKCGGPTKAGWCEQCRMNWMMQDQIDRSDPEEWRRITDSKAAQLSSPVAPEERQDEHDLFEDTKEAAMDRQAWLRLADDYKDHVKEKLDEAGLKHPFEHDDPGAFLKEIADEWHGKKNDNGAGKDAHRTAQPLGMPPAAAGMQFEHSNERSDGDRVVWDVSWEPEMVAMMSSADVEQNIRSYMLRAVSDEKTIGNDHGTRNWGTIADPRIEDIDIEAGLATVSFQTSEQAAPQVAPATVTE